jgi:hypothetical protein
MTTELANTFITQDDDTDLIATADNCYEGLPDAYVVSGSHDPAEVITGATLDPRRDFGTCLSPGLGSIAVTISDHVMHGFTRAKALPAVAVGSHLALALEQNDPAQVSLVGSRVRFLGPIDVVDPIEELGITYRGASYGKITFSKTIRFSANRRLHESEYALSAAQTSFSMASDREALYGVFQNARRSASVFAELYRPSAEDQSLGHTDAESNGNWIRDHSADYAGQWIALREGALLDADPSRAKLTARLRAEGRSTGATLVCLKD